jgi:Sec-independent protein translocase protein TatA
VFGVGIQEMIIIGLLLLVVFGPDKLTRTAHDLGKFVREARRSIEEFKAELTLEDDADRQHELCESGPSDTTLTPLSAQHPETIRTPKQGNRLK